MSTCAAPDQPTSPALSSRSGQETDAVREAVTRRLEQVAAAQRRQWAGLGEAGTELADCLSAALAGGKRARAVLAALGAAVLTEGRERTEVLTRPDVVGLGAALELYQASALVHDDVIDHADTRRGTPTTHRRLAALHRERGWRGQAQDWGESGAVLLGDLLLSLAGSELGVALSPQAGSGRTGTGAPGPSLPAGAAARVRTLFDEMTAEVAVGQYLDVRSELEPLPAAGSDPQAAGARMRASALEVVRRKSARYSVMYPLLLGATLAGVAEDSPTFGALTRFGELTGTAFQLRDDLLGVFGAPQVTGKPVGDDLREGKRTVLLALAWAGTDAAGRQVLRDLLTAPEPTRTQVDQAAALIRASGAPEQVEAEIDACLRSALEALDGLAPHVPADARLALAATARTLARRSA